MFPAPLFGKMIFSPLTYSVSLSKLSRLSPRGSAPDVSLAHGPRGVRPTTDPRGLSPRGPGASLGTPVRFLQLLPFGFYLILPFILAFLAPFSLHVF